MHHTTDPFAERTILGLDPNGRGIALLWASPALFFTVFPFIVAFGYGLTTVSGSVLFTLTVTMIISYGVIWLVNPTPARDIRLTRTLMGSHLLLFVVTVAMVLWGIHIGSHADMVNMLGFSFAAWIMQGPRRLVLPVLSLTLLVYGCVHWLWLPTAGFPVGVVASVVMTSLSRASVEADLRQRERQKQMLTIAQEQERLRIGSDLHDILGHSLTAIVMKAQLADRLMGLNRFEDARTHMSDLLELSRSSLAEVRAVVANMRSLNLDNQLEQSEALLESSGISVEVQHEGMPAPGPATTLFARILREATTNILGHSKATYVRIILSRTALEVRNNGYSATLSDKTRGSATGLQGLRENAEGLATLSWTGRGDQWILRAELIPSVLTSGEPRSVQEEDLS